MLTNEYLSIDPKRLRKRMVQEQLINRGITDEAVINAMSEVPRHLFVQEAFRAQSYEDSALPIGYGQFISQPYTVALMTQALELKPRMRVLEIGTGSGYQSAIIASMGCTVYTVERIRELHLSASALFRSMKTRAIHAKRDDGTLGIPEAAPFDRIIVTAGGPGIPEPLVNQLDDPGILIIPVGKKKRDQNLIKFIKLNGTTKCENLGNVGFVDLVGNCGW